MSNIIHFGAGKVEPRTPAEIFEKLMEKAKLDPANFSKLIIVWQDKDTIRQSESDDKLMASEAVYMLEQAKFDILKQM